jgi:hypothetical protein
MDVGDRVNVPFASGTKEGRVVRICDKSVWLRVDFPREPGKLIRRKSWQLESAGGKKRGRKSKTKPS